MSKLNKKILSAISDVDSIRDFLINNMKQDNLTISMTQKSAVDISFTVSLPLPITPMRKESFRIEHLVIRQAKRDACQDESLMSCYRDYIINGFTEIKKDSSKVTYVHTCLDDGIIGWKKESKP